MNSKLPLDTDYKLYNIHVTRILSSLLLLNILDNNLGELAHI